MGMNEKLISLVHKIKFEEIKKSKEFMNAFQSEKDRNDAIEILDGWKTKWKQSQSESSHDEIKHHEQNVDTDVQYQLPKYIHKNIFKQSEEEISEDLVDYAIRK